MAPITVCANEYNNPVFTKAQVRTPNTCLLVTNVLLNCYYMRIDPLEWKSQNSTLNAVELKERGLTVSWIDLIQKAVHRDSQTLFL